MRALVAENAARCASPLVARGLIVLKFDFIVVYALFASQMLATVATVALARL
jgi:hypothetical protein